jgi:hypothetical protein
LPRSDRNRLASAAALNAPGRSQPKEVLTAELQAEKLTKQVRQGLISGSFGSM